MALSPGYMEDALVLSHQFQSLLPMPGIILEQKPLFLEQIWSFLPHASTQLGFQDVCIIVTIHSLPTGTQCCKIIPCASKKSRSMTLPAERAERNFWVVTNSSVSTHLTVVLITGHNDESTIRHTSQSRLRNSGSSQTFEQCLCTPELLIASALL